jgi:hypothetical protein
MCSIAHFFFMPIAQQFVARCAGLHGKRWESSRADEARHGCMRVQRGRGMYAGTARWMQARHVRIRDANGCRSRDFFLLSNAV